MPEKTVIAVPRESAPGETRVALTPDTVRRLVSDELAVRVEQGAGALAAFPDETYSEAGAELVAGPDGLAEADIWVRVHPPREREDGTDEVKMIRSGGVLASFLSPAESPDLLRRLAERQVTALSIELLPRITRAQRMDALSAMSTVAGYKAVIIGADTLGKLFPLLITAAGTLSPAHVLVIGAGVAGLQAIATAHRLGAVVEAFDVRPAVKEQVESLGAKFVEAEEEHEVGGGETEEAAEFSRVRCDDYFRGAFHQDRGVAGDRRLLSPQAIWRGLTPVSMAHLPTGFAKTDVYCGQHWMLYSPAKAVKPIAFGHSGFDGTFAWAWPKRDLMVLYFTQCANNPTGLSLEQAIDRLLLHPADGQG